LYRTKGLFRKIIILGNNCICTSQFLTMNPFGNILYNTDEPNIYILTQLEISTIYNSIFTELKSEGRTNDTEILLMNLINAKLDDCHLCHRLRINLATIVRNISNCINITKPMHIPNNINLLPININAQFNEFKRIISRVSNWHIM
jgi:hypothetical protein